MILGLDSMHTRDLEILRPFPHAYHPPPKRGEVQNPGKKTGTHFADMIFLLALDQTKICGTQSPERDVTDVGLSLSLPSLT